MEDHLTDIDTRDSKRGGTGEGEDANMDPDPKSRAQGKQDVTLIEPTVWQNNSYEPSFT